MSSQLIQGKNLFFKEEQKESFFPTFILNVDSKVDFTWKKKQQMVALFWFTGCPNMFGIGHPVPLPLYQKWIYEMLGKHAFIAS